MIEKTGCLLLVAALLGFQNLPAQPERTMDAGQTVQKRVRVIVDNDFGGDPDGLFQLAHHLLSPSVEVCGVIGSHHYPDGFYGYPGTPDHGVAMAKELLRVMGMSDKIGVHQGAEDRLKDTATPIPSEAARCIVREALRDDVTTPLYVVCGAGLTDLASACLMEPGIGRRVTVVWIGGPEHEGMAAPPPGKRQVEYNLGIDVKAAQIVFNHSDLRIWQIPRDAYRQALVSRAELDVRLGGAGKLEAWLNGRLNDLMKRAKGTLGETYVLGDSPLVLVTALQSAWEPAPSSSEYVELPAPRISNDGWYEPNPSGRKIRVFRRLDTRLMMEDFYAKMSLFREREGK